MTQTTLLDQTTEMMNQFISSLPEDKREVLMGAFQRLLDSEVAKAAIKKGDIAPDFTLHDPHGKSINLYQLLSDGPVILSFYRGGWCPFCNLEFKALLDNLPEFKKYNAQILGVSPETPEVSMATVETAGLTFDVVCDSGNKIAREYGIVMQVDELVRPMYLEWGIDIPASNGDESFDLPVPATYVIGQDKNVCAAHVNKDYTNRMEPADILEVLKGL